MKTEQTQADTDGLMRDTPAIVSIPRERAAQLASGLSLLATWGRGYNAALSGRNGKRRRVPWAEDAGDAADLLRTAAASLFLPTLGSLPGFVSVALSYPEGRAAMRGAFPGIDARDLELESTDASTPAVLRRMMERFGELAKGSGALACSPAGGYVAVRALRRALDLAEAQTDEPHAWLSNPGGPQLLAAQTRDGCFREIAGKGDDWCTPYPVWTGARPNAQPFAPTPGNFGVGRAQAAAAGWVALDIVDGEERGAFLQRVVAHMAADRGPESLVSVILTQRAATAVGDFIVDHTRPPELRPLDAVSTGEGGGPAEAFPPLGVELNPSQPGAAAGYVTIENGQVVGWARTPEDAAENRVGESCYVAEVVVSFGNLDADAAEVAGWVSAHPDVHSMKAWGARVDADAWVRAAGNGWSAPQPFFLQAPPRLEADWPRSIPESMAEAYAETWRLALEAGNDYPGAARAVLSEFMLSHRPPAPDRLPAAYRSRTPGEGGTRLWARYAPAAQAAGPGGEVDPLFALPPDHAPLFAGYFVERRPYEGQATRDVEAFPTAEEARRFVAQSIFKDWRGPEPVYRGRPPEASPAALPADDLALLRAFAWHGARGGRPTDEEVERLQALIMSHTVPTQA